jgi:hypothetical protein
MSIFIQERSPLFHPIAAIFVLLAFWLIMLMSLRDTSQTVDEGVHATRGYTYWRLNDYRLNPANGNLPQRVIALPLLFGNYKFPSTTSEAWRASQGWEIAWQWFYEVGNDADAMARHGRAASGLFAIALGMLVWAWSRQLFGPMGGMLSLLLYVLNPTILANGALMTSDTAAALFFLAATWTWWRMLQRLTLSRIMLSAFAMAGLFVSKMSAVLIVPIVLMLTTVRLVDGRPLPIQGIRLPELRSRGVQFLAFTSVGIAHLMVVLVVVWTLYGFRYSAFSPAMPNGSWTDETWEALLDKPAPESVFKQLSLTSTQREQVSNIFDREDAEQAYWSVAALKAVESVRREALTQQQSAHLNELLAQPSPNFIGRIFENLRRYRLLPEAYIYGFAHAWHGSNERAAFFNGSFSKSGWRTFFPYTFLVKTPLSLFVVIGLSIAAAIAQYRMKPPMANERGLFATLYHTIPLWMLLGFYWTAAISSHLNIGHRHILVTYPPLFVLCGAAAFWLEPRQIGRRRVGARAAVGGLCLALVFLAAEVFYRFPHYLAYFNGIIKPARAYRHLVDSSLDWGQDLPGVRRYIETHRPTAPVYLSYFGSASPSYYRVPAIQIYSGSQSHCPPPVVVIALPEERSDEVLRDFLQRHPEYDDAVVSTVENDNKMFAILVKKPSLLRLHAGTYFISASLIQSVAQSACDAFGGWNERLENEYQKVREIVTPLLADDTATRRAALSEISPRKLAESINECECLAFHRLAAFLRQREPDDNVGFSILIYRVSDNDLTRALDGPPSELGRDAISQLAGRHP